MDTVNYILERRGITLELNIKDEEIHIIPMENSKYNASNLTVANSVELLAHYHLHSDNKRLTNEVVLSYFQNKGWDILGQPS